MREIERVHKELETQSFLVRQENNSKSQKLQEMEEINEKMKK